MHYTEWGIKISHISRGHCADCSGGREVGQVSFGRLGSTVFSTYHGLDRSTSGLCCWSILWKQPFCGWGIKISHNSRGHCAGCCGGREVGQVSFGRLGSTVFSTYHGLDRSTSGLCCWSVSICRIWFLKPIKKLFLCTFQKYIQFFSRYLLSFFILLQNVGDLYASLCINDCLVL
jgi:hypothetical protein